MSTSAKAKKGVSKDELRRLMKQQKSEGTVSHPLAKYPFLWCVKIKIKNQANEFYRI